MDTSQNIEKKSNLRFENLRKFGQYFFTALLLFSICIQFYEFGIDIKKFEMGTVYSYFIIVIFFRYYYAIGAFGRKIEELNEKEKKRSLDIND